MKLTGHNTLAMFTRYNTIDRDDAGLAMKMLSGFLKEKSAPIVFPREYR
jgi:hypothetical protein